MVNQYGIRKYAYYCAKCGQCHFITYESDELCLICNNHMLETPHEYNLTENKMLSDYNEFEQNQQRLFDEVISKSPQFDIDLYNNKDSIKKQQQEEFIVCGKAFKEGRDKGNPFGVECPNGHATNLKKITTVSKALHTALFGVFSVGRNSKEFHCNHCNSDF